MSNPTGDALEAAERLMNECDINGDDSQFAKDIRLVAQFALRSIKSTSELKMIYDEMHAVIRRWSAEGDNLRAFEVIAAMEAVKADFMDTLKRCNEEGERAT